MEIRKRSPKLEIMLTVIMISVFFMGSDASYAGTNELVIIFSGDNLGALEPGGCGCAPKRGGLARRATVIETLRKENENILLLDCGDLFLETRQSPELRGKIISKAMSLMQYDAINVGDHDLSLGIDFFKKAADTNHLPFVSANIRLPESPKQIKPFLIKKFPKFKVGITGVTDPVFLKPVSDTYKGAEISGPGESLDKTLSEMKGKVDFIILLSHLGEEGTLKYLERQDAGIARIVVVGHSRGLRVEPLKLNKHFVVQNNLAGESIGILKVKLDANHMPESCVVENNPLDANTPDHPDLAAMITTFNKDSLAEAENRMSLQQKQMEEKMIKETLSLSPEQFMEKMKRQEIEILKEKVQ